MIKKTFCLISICLILLSNNDSFSCTILTSSSKNAVFAGNNEDMCTTNTLIHIIPPKENKFGRLLWGFVNDENYQGGMNEYGLFFDGAGLSRIKIDKQLLPEYDGAFVMEGVLEYCKTVEDAIAFIKKYSVSFLAYCHILIADSTGDAVIMEWGNGRLNFVRKGDKNYLVATNFNQTESHDIGNECSRYNIASKILSQEQPSLRTFEKVLSHTHQEGNYCTVYSNICDLKSVKMYLYSFHNFSIYKEFDLKEEFKKGERKQLVRSFFPQSFAERNFRMRYDCINSCDEIPYKNVEFNIVTIKPVPLDTIYIRGSAVELGRWNKEGIQLEKVSNELYSKNIQIKEGALFDFELVLNNREFYPINKDGYRIKEIDIEVQTDTTINLTVFDWNILE